MSDNTEYCTEQVVYLYKYLYKYYLYKYLYKYILHIYISCLYQGGSIIQSQEDIAFLQVWH